MRIFAKKAFRFRVGDQVVTTKPMAFADVPDAVAKTPLFAWAKADGDIEVINKKADQVKAESDPGMPSNPKADGKKPPKPKAGGKKPPSENSDDNAPSEDQPADDKPKEPKMETDGNPPGDPQ